MSRRSRQEAAAAAASEAGRILQAQRKQGGDDTTQNEPNLDPAPPPQDLSDRPLPEVRNDVRDQAMQEIYDRDLRTKSADFALPAIGEEVPPEPPKAEQAPEPVPPTPEQMLEGGKFSEAPPPQDRVEAQTDATLSEPPPETIEYVRVKVDGEEFDAPKADVDEAGGIQAYRIQRAAENRLAKANEALAEAKRMQAAMLAQQAAAAKPAEPQVTNDEFIAQRLDAIRYGTPAEAAKALSEIQQRSAPPAVDQNAVINEAIVRMSYTNAVKQFDNEFKDLTADPDLMMIIRAKAQNGLQSLPADKTSVDFTEFFRKIGNEVRLKFNRPSQPPTPAVAPTTTTGNPSQVSREARKASIVNLPTAAARAEVPKESKPETREDILNDMRKSRGFSTG